VTFLYRILLALAHYGSCSLISAEVGESRLSRTVDTEPEESVSHSRHSSPDAGEDSRSRSRLSESYSPGENNASYSRLVYGNEDEEEDEEVHSDVEASHSSKPKVFSFAGGELRSCVAFASRRAHGSNFSCFVMHLQTCCRRAAGTQIASRQRPRLQLRPRSRPL
jgi:hypothetical protein